MIAYLRRFVRRGLLGATYKVSQMQSGIPPALDFDTLNNLCLDHRGSRLLSASYRHLSAWKQSGAFHLALKLKRDQIWNVVCKNSVYDYKEIPALRGLPIIPGRAEYVVYQFARKSNLSCCPKVYLCREASEGKHYQYILEYLGKRNFPLQSERSFIKATNFITQVQDELSNCFNTGNSEFSVSYISRFPHDLYQYTKDGLARYTEIYKSRGSHWDALPGILDFYLVNRENDTRKPVFIHGDYNASNVLVDFWGKTIKVIDWEWAGIGPLHSDLATMLKRVDSRLEEKCLRVFARQHSDITLEEHRYMYELCQIERGLLDAGFLSIQHVETKQQCMSLDIPQYIEESLARAFIGYQYCKNR